jgi:hypothetical protein
VEVEDALAEPLDRRIRDPVERERRADEQQERSRRSEENRPVIP